MSNEKKVLTLRIIFGVLVASVLLLGALTVIKVLEVKRLEKQVENVKTVNQSLLDSSVSEYVVLNFVDIDGSITPYLVNKNLGMSIYDFLLTTPDLKIVILVVLMGQTIILIVRLKLILLALLN